MRDIQTLFPTDGPVPRADMIGRGEDVDRLVRELGGGVNIVLAGPRRTGKTSVAQAALEALRAEGHYVAAVDLFSRRDAGDLAAGIAEALLANRPAVHRLLQRGRDLAGTARDAARLTATARLRDELGDGVEIALTPGGGGAADPSAALTAALELPQRLADADGRRVVLFLDEFQDLASPSRPFGDPDRLTKQMRAIFQRSPRVSLLFAGSVEHVLRDLFGPSERALSQFGSYRPLSPITAEEWDAGLRSRWAELGLELEPLATARLLELADSHPRAIMLVARETVAQTLAGGERRTGAPEVEAGFGLALASDRLRHEQALERIKLTKHALRVAMRVARGQAPYSGLQPSAGQRALRALQVAGLVESPERGSWRVGDPLLRRYLADLPGA